MKQQKIAVVAIVIVLAFFSTITAFAHGDEPRLEISAERINPGGVMELRGVDFEFEEQISLALIGAAVEIPVGGIAADTEGVFLQIITLPGDLKEGFYHFRAVTDDHEILSPALLVQGPAISSDEEGGQGPRDEEDPLLAPMPAYPPSAIPVSIPPAEKTSGNDLLSSWLAASVVALIILGVGILLGRRVIRGR